MLSLCITQGCSLCTQERAGVFLNCNVLCDAEVQLAAALVLLGLDPVVTRPAKCVQFSIDVV